MKQGIRILAALVSVAGLLFGASTAARASTYYVFDYNTGCCNATGYGYVELITNTSSDLKFSVNLWGDAQLHASNSFETVTFQMVAGASVSTFAATDTSYTFQNDGLGSYHQDGAGTWNWGIKGLKSSCSDPGNPCGSSVTFEFTGTGLGFTPQSLGGVDVYFTADIANPPGSAYTGVVGATLYGGSKPPEPVNPPAVPLPGAFMLMGSVLAGGVGFGAWRRRRIAKAN